MLADVNCVSFDCKRIGRARRIRSPRLLAPSLLGGRLWLRRRAWTGLRSFAVTDCVRLAVIAAVPALPLWLPSMT
jgi:hypothetical protein